MVAPVVTGFFEAVAVVICLSWIWVNAYHYYPMIATSLGSLAGRTKAAGRRVVPSVFAARFGPIAGDATGTAPLPDEELPTIDVLLPAYREEEVIEHSIASVNAADYPQDKLTVSVLVEPDDDETRAGLRRIEDDLDFETITVPESYPGDANKPRALNYGFEQTDGDVVSITDAEDVVHPQLYRRVAGRLDEGYDYVQGRLDMVNEDDGWMNTLFRAEYGYWYMVNTWAKYYRGYPIPLGGTTCFFPRELLETMSDRRLEKYGDPWDDADWEWIRGRDMEGYRPWDPQNVTEDFELGLFLWQEGYDARYVKTTPTDEESPLSLDPWVKQRTRWKKGKIYTFVQYAKHPPESLREKVHIYTQSAVPHLGPVNLAAVVVILLGANLLGYPLHPVTKTALLLGFVLAAIIVALYSYGYWTVSDRDGWTRLRRAATVGLTLPVYWLMQWLADLRALKQAYTGELHWAKTTHFGRNVDPDGNPEAAIDAELAEEGETVNPDGGFRQSPSLGPWRTPSLSRRTRLLALAGIVVLGVALRVYGLDGWSLYGDELYSITSRGALPPSEILTVPIPLDSHPPLYYLLLHFWMDLFGNSVASARALSVILSAAGMVLLYLLGAQLYDDRVGLLAALLYAVSTFQIHYGRIARMYSLFVVLTLASWYTFVRLREKSTASAVGYVLSTVLLVYTHVFALFVVASQYLYVFLSETRAGIDWRRWATVQAAVGLLSLPWIAMLGNHVLGLLTGAREGSIIAWVPEPNVGIITHTILRYVGWPNHFPLLNGTWSLRAVAAVIVVVYSACLVLAILRFTSDREYAFGDLPTAGQLGSLLVVPIAVPFLISYLIVPVYFPRFTIPASLALFLLVAVGIVNVTGRRRQFAIVAVVLLCSGVLVGQYHATDTAADWEGSAACINEGAEPGDAVLYQTFWTQNYVEYYQDTPDGEKFGVLSPDELEADREYGMNRSQVAGLAEEFDRIWLFQYQPSDENRLLSTLRETHDVALVKNYGPILVYRLERTPSDDPAAPPTSTGLVGAGAGVSLAGGDGTCSG
ncbi:hypothetical protein BRC81_02675 [Halobacteriales archaeon QS_1_68_20]|nr:MAG: hypothetical protein BRC81_02675 [Halobacteriales archaeon QS_1_68_20]